MLILFPLTLLKLIKLSFSIQKLSFIKKNQHFQEKQPKTTDKNKKKQTRKKHVFLELTEFMVEISVSSEKHIYFALSIVFVCFH